MGAKFYQDWSRWYGAKIKEIRVSEESEESYNFVNLNTYELCVKIQKSEGSELNLFEIENANPIHIECKYVCLSFL